MEDFKGSATSLVADVDCTADGKELCEKHDVRGYPTIKYGDPAELKDFNGGRTYEDLKKFADENLGPSCGPSNLDLCPEADKKKLEVYMKMSEGKLEGKVRNSIKVFEEEVPIMKKVLAHMKKEKGGEL